MLKLKNKKKNINNKLFNYYFNKYQNPTDMYKTLRETKGKKNEDQVYSIKEILDKIKNKIKNLPENKVFIIEGNEKIINIVKRILYFNQLEQQDLGPKILTPDQMLSRLPITLAQLKAGNNSEKLKTKLDKF